jgi:hypothetical protein
MLTRLVVVLSAAALVAACSSRNVLTDLEVVEVSTGWYDLGVVAEGPDLGKNKLVPSVSLKLKNVSQEPISGVQLDAVFRHVNQDQIIDEHFVPGVASNASLDPGATTNAIVLRAKWGFVGEETRDLMLQNSRFQDARVTILGRHGRNNWATMREITIERRLLTQ